MLYTQNRLSEDRFGTGLPFYRNVENQERFKSDLYTYGAAGHWICPSNQLPTWQLRAPSKFNKVELIKTEGKKDVSSINLPLSEIESVQVNDSGSGGSITFDCLFTTPTPRSFTLCGTYYFRLTFDGGVQLYSEVFNAGVICGVQIDFSGVVVQVNQDDSVDMEFNFAVQANNISSAVVNILGTDYGVGTFQVDKIPIGTYNITITIETENCGTFTELYVLDNKGGGNVNLDKTYQ